MKLKYGENAKLCYMDTDVSLYTEKQMRFITSLQKMLKQSLTLQIMS